MQLANQKLSKQLQELSGWEDIGRKDGVEQYTLDFLLHKLREAPNLVGLTLRDEGYYKWRITASVHRVLHSATGRIPADAPCALAIKLFQEGILIR